MAKGALTNCLKIHGISVSEAKYIRRLAANLRGGKQKLTADVANIRAVSDLIAEVKAERESIIRQVQDFYSRRKTEGAEFREKVQTLLDTGQMTEEELEIHIRNKTIFQRFLSMTPEERTRDMIGEARKLAGEIKDYPDLQKEMARSAMPDTAKINDITKGEAVQRLAKGDETVLPHLKEGVDAIGSEAMKDEVYNKALGKAVIDKTLEDFRKVESQAKEIMGEGEEAPPVMEKAAEQVGKPAPAELNPIMLERIKLATSTQIIGDIQTLLLDEKDKKHFNAIKSVSIIVDSNINKLALTEVRKLTPAQIKAGVPSATIFVKPNVTIEALYHEMIHADRAAKGRKIEGKEWPHPEEHRAFMGGKYFAERKSTTELIKDLNDAIGDKGGSGEGGADISKVVPILMDIGKIVYADGHQTYIQFKNQMKETLGTAYDKVKNIMLKIWEMVKRFNEQMGERGSIRANLSKEQMSQLRKLGYDFSHMSKMTSEQADNIITSQLQARKATGQVKDEELENLNAAMVKVVRAANAAYRAGNKEGYAKEKAKMVNMFNRVKKIRAVRDYFGLTDAELKTISRKNPLLMSQYEFKLYLDEVRQKALELIENSFEKARIMQVILEKDLKKVNNYRQALDLPPITKMTTKQAEQFADILEPFHEGDVFLTIRELETVDRTDLAGIRTWREAKERLSKETGVSVEDLEKIKVTEFDKFRWDTPLAEKNPFYKMVVTETTRKLLEGNIRYHDVENKIFELAKKSEKSRRGLSLIERAIPQDKQILEYIEAPQESKESIARTMTPEQLDYAHYIQTYFENALEYLIKENALEKGRENYFVHVRRSFLENAKEEGLVTAVKDIFTNAQEDMEVFQILDKDTGKILPLEKFFQFSLHRSGALKPSANITKAFLTYARTFEKKVSLDEIIPKIDIYAQSLTPQKLTPRGLEKDRSMKTFINEYINNKKGRRIDQMVGKQGGIIDTSIRGLKTFTTLLDLGLNIPVGLTSYVGESVANFISLGVKKAAIGTIRVRTDKGKRIIKKYEAWLDRSVWENFTAPGKEIQERLAEGLFGLFHQSMVDANRHFLLGNLTEEEYKNETIDNQRLADLKIEMGRWRVVPSAKSLVGSTAIGSAAMQYKTWAAPVIRTTAKDISTLIRDLKNKPSSEALTTREAKEIYRIIGVTSTILIVMSIASADEDDKSFVGQLLQKAFRESLTLVQGVDPKLWLATPRVIGFLTQLGENLHAIFTLEEYKTREGYKGIEGLEKQLTPRAVKQFQQNNQPKGRERR